VLSGSNGQNRNGAPPRAAPGWHDVIRVAARASVDPKTVRRYLDGDPTRATTRRRIEKGLASCGLVEYVRKTA